jgi:hypothetical protein
MSSQLRIEEFLHGQENMALICSDYANDIQNVGLFQAIFLSES